MEKKSLAEYTEYTEELRNTSVAFCEICEKKISHRKHGTHRNAQKKNLLLSVKSVRKKSLTENTEHTEELRKTSVAFCVICEQNNLSQKTRNTQKCSENICGFL